MGATIDALMRREDLSLDDKERELYRRIDVCRNRAQRARLEAALTRVVQAQWEDHVAWLRSGPGQQWLEAGA